jgi:hypothetical protein
MSGRLSRSRTMLAKERVKLNELVFLYLFPLAVVLSETLILGLQQNVPGSTVVGLTIAIVLLWGIIGLAVGIALYDRLRGRRRRKLRVLIASGIEVYAYVAGATVAFIYNFDRGIFVSNFCRDAAPLIAALVVAMVFEGSTFLKSETDPVQLTRWRLAMSYILSGVFIAMMGTLPGHGLFYAFALLAVAGSLSASAVALLAAVRRQTAERMTESTDNVSGS